MKPTIMPTACFCSSTRFARISRISTARGTVSGWNAFGFISLRVESTLCPNKRPRSLKETHAGYSAELCLKSWPSEEGGKQAILKCADHRFVEQLEFVTHNGRTSFPWTQARAPGEYHERAERCKSFRNSRRRSSAARLFRT